jgi:translation initiation factor 4A
MQETLNSEVESKNICEKWDDFNLKPSLLRGIYSYGFEMPSNIQKYAIPYLISGKDIIGQAQSGSGKTGTFAIGTLQRINVEEKTTQAIVIAPTHELVKQIAHVFRNLGGMMDGLVVKTIIGGTVIIDDANDLKTNTPHIIVGCTGRIYDMIKRNYIKMTNIRIMVLDEADEMLSQGFKEQIYNIFQHCGNDMQVALFSATMPDEMMTLTEKFMRDPVKIRMTPEELNLECIQQYYVALENDANKFSMIKDLYSILNVSQSIIYVNSVKRVVDLYSAMNEEGYPVCCIHSSMTKNERENALLGFRNGTHRILISSNITARGIDVQQVQTVINFDVPRCVHTYLHRIGRSGRFGRKGIAINFITRSDIFHMKNIEKHYGSTIVELPSNFTGGCV